MQKLHVKAEVNAMQYHLCLSNTNFVYFSKSNWRPQPALPGIQGDNRAIRGLSANIEDQDMYLDKKNRLTPIGQEAKNYYEEEAAEDIQVKKKKTKKKKREKVETDDIQD